MLFSHARQGAATAAVPTPSRARSRTAGLLLASVLALAAAPALSGSAAAQTAPAPGTSSASSPGAAPASSPQAGIALNRVRRHVLVGRSVRLAGRVGPAEAGRSVVVERRARGRWAAVARTTTRSGGAFTARYRPRRLGAQRLRARVTAGANGGLASPAAVAPSAPVTVYRSSHASWYGPGLYGNRTACGQRLTPGLRGVAHKRLPCGTRVTFRRAGRSVTVPVVDRGPFVGGRTWDLTAATRAALRFPSTGNVWSDH
jgi:hypothetical protein